MLALVVILGATVAMAAVGGFILYRDHGLDRYRLVRVARDLNMAHQERDEAWAEVGCLEAQVRKLHEKGHPEIARLRQEADGLKRKVEDREQELEAALQGRQQAEERIRSLEGTLEHFKTQRDQERARVQELGERLKALAEKNDRLKAEAHKRAELLEAAQDANTALTRRHNDLVRRQQALVRAVEEHSRSLGTPGWYAESLKLLWQAAGATGDPVSLRLPPLPDYLGQCVRHWQELDGAGRQQAPVERERSEVHGKAVAN
jgi:uncharacterized protein (DUF3084 family)